MEPTLESSNLGSQNTDSGTFPNLTSLKPPFPYPQSGDGKGTAFLGLLCICRANKAFNTLLGVQ